MAFKQFQLEELVVTIFKRKTSRSLRLSVTAKGDVRVSIPVWVPYSSGIEFARARMSWIRSQRRQQPLGLLLQGQAIGKAHRLFFVADPTGTRVTSRIKATEIVVRHPPALSADEATVQEVANRACIRALRLQAEQLLPMRLKDLAKRHGYTYNSVAIKLLKSRWGSCDHDKNITLNLFLMQLPWDCIDYVLVHELVHTKVMQHGQPFWAEMAVQLPAVKELRRRMRSYQPILHTGLPLAVA